MRTTYRWLKDYVDLEASPHEVADRLTMLGLEVESLTKAEPGFRGVVVGKIVSVEPLSGSDHLVVARVDAGPRYGVVSVVSGAPNVVAGSYGALALPGAELPGGVTIATRRFGEVESVGMLCSEAELGLTSRADRIWLLDERPDPGTDIATYLGEDWVLEINVTPNRPDCLGTIGIARELAAAYGLALHLPDDGVEEGSTPVDEFVRVVIEDPDGCPRYTARYLWDVRIGPSPFWLARRLELAGMRSINNVVDVTNYVMLEYGQPLHAFDYDLLDEGTIVVRLAEEGEEFITLDGKLRKLHADTLMICDKNKPVAIAGVMGGENSEVRESTTRVLLESAYFSPLSIRRTRRKLAISTESSYRFERGVDPNGVVSASNRAAKLMAITAGAKVARGIVDVYPRPVAPWSLKVRPRRVNQVLGTKISSGEMTRILVGLGMSVSREEDHLVVTVPTFRPDLTREIDVVEEIARHYGYDRIDAEVYAHFDQSLAGEGEGRDPIRQKARHVLTGLGLYEAVNLSLISRAQAEAFTQPGLELARVVNPLGEEFAWLRPSLIPGLLTATARNLNRRQERVFLFEWGKVFAREPGGGYIEEEKLAGTICGEFLRKTWRTERREVDFYDLKGIVETLVLDLLGGNQLLWERGEHKWAEEGGFNVRVRGNKVGAAGLVDRDVLALFECERPVFAFELDWSRLRELASTVRAYRPIPRYPSVEQDLAILVDEAIQAGAVEAVIWKAGGPYLKHVELFDVYRGKQIPAGKKSLAYSLSFQSEERTLTEYDVRTAIDTILQHLEKELGAALRPR